MGELKEMILESLRRELNRKNYKEEDYVKPELKPLTQQQIDDIHKRGKITPEEQVKEYETMGLCAPGNSGFNERCHNFANCHDCLVDYVKDQDEYTSIFELLKEPRLVFSNNMEKLCKYLNEETETKKQKIKK